MKRKRMLKKLVKRVVIHLCSYASIVVLAAIMMGCVKVLPDVLGAMDTNVFEDECPDSLMELLERNPETEEFVLGYQENKDANLEIDLSSEIEYGEIPLFLQWDKRWGYKKYGSDFMALNGCGPTCLSMVRCGLGGDDIWNPLEVAKMSKESGYYVDGIGTSWDLMTSGAREIGLEAHEVIYDEFHILEELQNGNPIICIMGPGDFTTSGHFIVLTGVDENGQVTVCDPNSRINSEKAWDVEVLMSQMRNLWGYSYAG